MYRQGLPATISYPPRSRLPHRLGVGSRRASPSSRNSLTRASRMASALARRRVSLRLLEIPSQEVVVNGRYLIVSHKFFACLSESLGVESESHLQSLRVHFLHSYSTSSHATGTGVYVAAWTFHIVQRGQYDCFKAAWGRKSWPEGVAYLTAWIGPM